LAWYSPGLAAFHSPPGAVRVGSRCFVASLVRSNTAKPTVHSVRNPTVSQEHSVFKFTSTPIRHTALVVALALTQATAWAIPEAQFQPAFAQFLQATTGNESAVELSADSFAALLKQEPANPVLMAYAGATTAMKATTTMLPWKKMGYAEDGMALLDKALALLTPAHNAALQHDVPSALEVRFVAANTFLAVPGFMNRAARGNKLLGEILASPLLAQAPLSFRGDVWMKAAQVAAKDKRTDEARKYLNEVISANAPQQQAARAQLGALAS
jgi:tetratricopeptide (TPR) repeat protein